MDSRQFLARLERERQALAQRDHPNLARVYAAGLNGTLAAPCCTHASRAVFFAKPYNGIIWST